MYVTRSRPSLTLLAAGGLLFGFGFAACSDALMTAPRSAAPRPDTAIPVANVAADPSPVVVAAGDIADCSSTGDEATALLLDGLQFDAVLVLGDLAYQDGTATEFTNCYNPTWGRHKAKTFPTPGNHEYHTSDAKGYFGYFGTAARPAGESYYSFNLGEWHVLSLNSNISASPGSDQLNWIRQDLAANPRACTLAFWHHPVVSSGEHGNISKMAEAWRVLDSAGVDIVLAGHDHNYERFAPQTATGIAIPTGMREFVVGTGGRKLRTFSTIRANSEVRSNEAWGVLKLTLNATSYEWKFLPVAGKTFTDQGTADCVQTGPPEPNEQPVVTLNLPENGATFTAPATITLSATASDADGNLNRVDFYRFSTLIGSDATPPYSITWRNVADGNYSLTARAVDTHEAWTESPASRIVVTVPPSSAPTVTLTSPLDDVEFTAPATITLEATAADADGNLSRVEFYQGTTLLGTATASPYTFTWSNVAAGDYTLTARAVDATDAATTSTEVRVSVNAPPPPNAAPTVALTGPPEGATFTAPAAITITATASDPDAGDAVARVEFLNDETVIGSATASPYSFTWSDVAAGSYTLTARAVDGSGAIATSAAVHVTVGTAPPTNAPPVANPGGPYSGAEGVPLTVDGAASTDAENGQLTYAWDFGDGTTATGASAAKTYGDNGTYTITLVVTDPGGASHRATTTATITNVAPTLTFVWPAKVPVGQTYVLSVTDAADVPADQAGLEYRFECVGGGGYTLWSSAPSTTCPAVAGPTTGTVRGAVRDKDGSPRQQSRPIEILAGAANSAPTISLTAPLAGAAFTAPATIRLEATAGDADGNLSRVEFYQGTTLLGTATASPYAFNWTGVPAGTYALTARAVDAAGAATPSSEARVTVNAAPPPNQPPVANPGGPYAGVEGVAMTLDGGGSTDPENGALIYAWSFGDGTSGTGRSPAKTYSDNGTYTITLVVSDPAGASHSATGTVTVTNVAPTGTFTAPATVASGEAYTLAIAGASDVAADQPGLQYQFDCGAGYGAWGAASSISCPGVAGPATRTVRGAVRDKDGGVRELSGAVTVGAPANRAPTVSLSAPADNAVFTAPATITLDATAADADGNLSRVEFYNGATLLGSDASAPYSFTWTTVPAGSYVLTARAVDAAGASATSVAARVTVNAPNQRPVANAGGPYTGTEGAALTLDAGASRDPEGGALTYAWDFGDGTSGAGRTPAKTYGDNGTYAVTVTVSDPAGATHSATTTATVVNAAPTGALSAPASVASGAPYTLSIANAADVAADQPGLQYQFDCGAGYGAWGGAASASCPGVPGPATRAVRGAIRDKDAGVRELTASVAILPPSNVAPTVSLSAPAAGASFPAPATITLQANAADADGNLSRVEFYHGTTLIGSASASPYAFTWANVPAGSYSLTARAVDAAGAAATSAAVTVTVNGPPVANAGGPYAAAEGVALRLDGSRSSDPDGGTLAYAWDFGDGTSGSGPSPSKTYGDNGTYTIRLVVSDAVGASHAATTTAVIANVAPTGSFSSPASVASGAAYTLAFTDVSDVAADQPGLQYQFDCGAGYGAWGAAPSASCAGVSGPVTRAVRGAVRDKDGGAREFSGSVGILAPPNRAPSVSLVGPLEGASFTAPAAITLSALAADVDGNLSRVEFYQGALLLGSAASSPYSFEWAGVAAGSYTLTARAVDAAGEVTTSTAVRVTVVAPPPPNRAPVAHAGGPYTGTEGVALALNGGGSSDPENGQLTYAWTFGDGTTATGPTPSKVYADNGTYTITLVVADPSGASHSATTTATIANAAPKATLSATPSPVDQGGAFTLALDDPLDAGADLASLQFAFDCGDGSGFRPFGAASAASCATVAHGTRAVRAAVRDKEAASSEYSASVPITNVAPTVTIVSAPASIKRWETFRLDFRFNDPGLQDGAWSYTINWGDGQTSGPTSVATQGGLISVTHRNRKSGIVVVTIRVTDKPGAAGQATITFNVPEAAPVANAGGPYAGTEGVSFALDGAASSDPENGTLTYAWDFGDGTTGTGASPSKTYTDNGTYTIKLVVTDPTGETGSATTTATIANAAPTGTFSSPAAVASGSAFNLAVSGASDVAADRAALEYQFDCGAGYGAWGGASSASCPGVPGPARRAVRGAVRDKDGGVSEFSASVDILAPPNSAPSVSLTGPLDGATFTAPATITLSAMAADADANLIRVEFYNGATLLGSDAAVPYTFSWTSVASGTYALTARAVDAAGASSVSTVVRVTVNARPTANAGGPYTRAEGVALTLDGGGSTDPNNDPLTYTWDFGDGTTASGRSPSKTYGDNGTYAITLIVSDPFGATHSATSTATITNVAPTGTFVSPASVESGASYTLAIVSAADVAADRPSLEYRFDCGSGYGGWGAAASAPCAGAAGPATRVARAEVRDKDGGAREFTASVEILNTAPTVSLTGPADGATFNAPASITLSAAAGDADGNLSRVEFYRGTTLLGSDASAPYAFTWANVPVGSYTLTARAVDAAGAATTSGDVRVTVTNQAPVANAGGPYAASEGVALTVDGGGSTDPNGDALTYAWDFGDGTTATGRAPSKSYGDNGTYTITVVVSDPAGASHTATATATIANVPPTFNLVAPATIKSGEPFTLSITSAADVPADQPGLQYQFNCGAGFGAWGSATSVTCPGVTGPATRTVRGAVRDKDGGTRQQSRDIEVLNSAPSVSLTAPLDGASLAAPATITLEASASDIDGNLSRVEFLSGTTVLGSDATQPFAFTWAAVPAGTYVVTARAVDAAGATTTSAAARVTVVNTPPVSIPGGPYAGSEGVALTLDGGGSKDPNGDALTYAWTFGDGTSGTGRTPSKTYGDNGTYTVTLVVADPSGATHSAATTATIANVPPTLTFVAPATLKSAQPFTLTVGDATDVAADQATLEYRFNCGSGYGAWGRVPSASCAGATGPAALTVRAEVRDKDGGTREQSRVIEIVNSAPSVFLTAPLDGASLTAPATITLTATATDADGNLSRVDFLNGTTVLGSASAGPYSFTWSNVPAGTYTLRARAVDAVGATTTSAQARVTVVNTAPVAHPGGPYGGREGVPLTVDGGGSTDANGDALSYTWDFGDGTSGTGRSPSKTYGDNGTYTITLVVSDPLGATHTATAVATIENVAPTGTFVAPATVESGATYTLAISNAADVAADGPGLEYRFDCGSGFGAWGAASSVSCAGGPGPATRAVGGAVRDKDGGVRESSASVAILNAAPTVSLTAPADGATFTAPAALTLSASASDVDGNLARVEFYNGTTLLGSSTAAPHAFAWNNVPAGNYTLTARAVDAAAAATTSSEIRITVSNQAPVAHVGGPYTGSEGVPLTVDAGASSDPNGDALTYAWDFGDGTTATGVSPSKTYADNGTYTITLVVSDPLGASHSVTTTATIDNVAPTLTVVWPATIESGKPYTLSVIDAADAPADQPGLEYRFDCGSTGYTPWSSTPSTTCPAVAGPSTVTVRGAVRDKDGGTRQQSRDVDVLPPPAYVLVIDNSSLAPNISPNNFSDSEVSRDLSNYATRTELRWFAANAGRTITLYSGSVGSEGFHALKTIPASWNTAGPTTDGLRNFLRAGPGLGSPDANGNRQTLLSTVPDVTPLRATGLRLLIGQPVCALVRDGNVSTSYNPLRANLTGRYLGIVAFVVNSVTPRTTSSTVLPAVSLTVRDADQVCAGALQLLLAAPAPTSSSSPNDTGR